METFNILFPAPGRRVTLLKHFRRVLSELGLQGKIVGADISLSAPAMHIVDKKYRGLSVSDPDYISQLLEISELEDIDLIIPLIDPELLVLSENKTKFEQIGTFVLVSEPQVIKISSNKHNTYRFFRENSIDTPEVISISEALRSSEHIYPLLMKPAVGSASIDVHKISNREELEFFSTRVEEPVLQEYVDGDEYTVSVLVDLKGRVRCIVPRRRLAVRAGEVSKGMTVKNRKIMETVERAVRALNGAVGPINVQGILNKEGEFKLIEINPRFGGGDPLAIKAGADFPRWIIEMMLGKDPEIAMDSWKDGLVMLRYDSEIFVEREAIENEVLNV